MADFSLNIGMLAVAFAFLGGLLLTGAYRRWAIRVGVMDRPNERSSHVIPTPRGGGAALVVSAALSYLFLYILGKNSAMFAPAFWAILLAFVIALVGFFDDRFNLSVRLRFGSQILLAAASVGIICYFYLGSSWIIASLAVIFIIWMTNLFNFMDGIDGIAAGHVMTAGLSFAYIHYTLGEFAFQFHYLILAALGVGFLIWNWQPAKIFMGDVGSCFFGFIFAVLAVWAHFSVGLSLPIIFILHMSFLLDTTYTLLVRGSRKQKVYQAHRDHAYQHAVQSGLSHAQVSMIYMAVNLLWLLPIALYALNRPELSWGLVGISMLPLLAFAFYFKAGIKP